MATHYTANETSTPMAEPLEYISVESYNWPKPPPSNRTRFDKDERRRRHRECQKRFLARKQQVIKQLRVDLIRLEQHLKLMWVMRETEELQIERGQLVQQLTRTNASHFGHESGCSMHLHGVDDNEEEGLVALVADSVNLDELIAEFGHP